MEENKWMIVKKEKISTKIKNYFKNIFSKMLNNQNKKKKSKGIFPKRQEKVQIVEEKEVIHKVEQTQPIRDKKEITIELETKKKPKEIIIEYENVPKKKQIVVEYEKKEKQRTTPPKKEVRVEANRTKNQQPKKTIQVEVKQNKNTNQVNKKQVENKFEHKKVEMKNEQPRREETKKKVENKIEHKKVEVKKEQPKREAPRLEKKVVNIAKEVDKIKKDAQTIKKEQPKKEVFSSIKKEQNKKEVLSAKKEEPKKEELALKPVKAKKEKKPFNIFQFFKDKDRKKRKEILNRVRENKADDYETISTKTKLSKGSIAVEDVDANELDPLINLYRDSNKKLRNRIKESQL